jgi:hypothetical protein
MSNTAQAENTYTSGVATNCAVDVPPSGGAHNDQQGALSQALRLAGAALAGQPGSAEALASYTAILDAVARHEEAMVAFGKLLVACANDAAGQSNALKRLIEVENLAATRLDQLTQVGLLRSWHEELEKPRHADPKRLLRYGFKVYSQCDEDGIIQEIFRRIGTTNRVFVEFGVEAGSECNSAKLLVEGWRGLWLDGQQQLIDQIHKNFKPFIESGKLEASQAFITAENIDSLIAKAGVTGAIDFLTIDIDHNDYWVWQAINVIQPRVVAVEYNATLHPPLSVVVPYEPNRTWNGTNYFGASLEALVRLGRSKGYRLVGCSFSGTNAFFVRDELVGDLFLEPATAEQHYEPPRYYFGYLKAGHRAQPGPYVTV